MVPEQLAKQLANEYEYDIERIDILEDKVLSVILKALEAEKRKVERAREALQEIDKNGSIPRAGEEWEHWENGNFDDSYDYGVEMGEYYAGETARKALKELEG